MAKETDGGAMDKKTLDASVTDAMKSSQEAQEMATVALQRLSSQYGMDNMSGTDAAKVLQQYDDRHKEAMKLIRKNYGDDIRGFDKFMLAYGAKMEDERRSIAKMCGAEMRHGLGVAVKTDTENRFADIEHRDMLDGASITAGQAVANEEASEAFHSRLDEIDSEAEEAKVRARQDYESAIAQEGADKERLETEYKAKIAAIDSATSISRGATAGESVDALKKIKGMESSNAASKAKPLRDDFRNIFIQRLKAEGSDCLGHSPEIAMANALQATRNGVIGYFTNRIKSGQVAAVLATLDELEKLGDDDFEASKAKSPTGVYDPSAYGFLRKSDIEALRKCAVEQISYYQHIQSLKNAGRDEGLKIANSKIRFEADRLARQPILDMDAMEQLFSKTEELINAGLTQGAETSTYLRGIVERAERKLSRTQKEASKLQTEEDFEREYNTFMRDINGAAPMYFFSQTADGKDLLQFTMDESGNPVHIDGQNRMILLIRNGLSRGVVKGKVWNERLEQLENGRAMEDRYAAMSALADAGISFDPKGTQNVIDARGGSYADMSDERGGVSASSWGEDKATHRLRVGNPQMMMYTYRDPVTGRTVPINGTQLNDLLEEVGLWQMRHPNPSPTGGKPVELTEFIRRSLDRAIVRETKKHWFSSDEHNIPVGFGDIRSSAHREYEAYFAPRGNVPVYGRDIWGLQGKVLGCELPTTETIRKFLTNPEIWTSKKGK